MIFTTDPNSKCLQKDPNNPNNNKGYRKLKKDLKREFEQRGIHGRSHPISTKTNNGKSSITGRVFEDGSRVQIRTEGKSGHPKVEITDKSRNTFEKITILS